MASDPKQVNIRFESNNLAEVRDAAKEIDGMDFSKLVRAAVEQWMRENGHPEYTDTMERAGGYRQSKTNA